ncbi:hypothetical protein J4Q44_G00360110 [Coregonus suidteri]|uniref:Uncharacterized protein n=1 Tax=Coregonus suidteri TaxID=861788 RepID=A0AAN8KQW3_9TELE
MSESSRICQRGGGEHCHVFAPPPHGRFSGCTGIKIFTVSIDPNFTPVVGGGVIYHVVLPHSRRFSICFPVFLEGSRLERAAGEELGTYCHIQSFESNGILHC